MLNHYVEIRNAYIPGVLTNPGVGGVPDISIEFGLLLCATSLLLDVDDDIVTFE